MKITNSSIPIKSLFATVSILLSLLSPHATTASGLQVSPARLEAEIRPEDGPVEFQLTVSNPTADVMLFELSADEFPEIFELMPASFTLESGSRQPVRLRVNPGRSETARQSGIVQTEISVLGRPLAGGELSAATGVRIPITIRINAEIVPAPGKQKNLASYAALAILSALVLYFLLERKRLLERMRQPPKMS